MKRLLATIVSSWILVSGTAQNSSDFPTENAHWTNLYYFYSWSGTMQGPPDTFDVLSNPQFSMTDQDTVIDGVTYNQIFLDDSLYQGATRNEGDKVYFVLHGEVTESLLYDFGAQEGDSIFDVITGTMGLNGIESDEYELRDYYVTQVDTVIYDDGIERKRFHLNYDEVKWVQGIGNMQGLFWYGGANVSSYVDELVRFCRNDQIVFLPDSEPFFPVDASSCSSGFTTLGLSDYKNSKFKLYPNPSNDNFYINPLDGQQILRIRIIDSTGIVALDIDARYTAESPIDVSKLPSGIYYVQIISEVSNSTKKIVKE